MIDLVCLVLTYDAALLACAFVSPMNREALFPRKIPNGILRNDVSGEARWQRRQITRAQSYHLLGSGADCFVTQGPLVRVSAKQPNSRSRTTAGDSVRGVAELSAVVPRLSPNCPRRASTPVGYRRLTPRASRCLCDFGRRVSTMVRPGGLLRIPLGTPLPSSRRNAIEHNQRITPTGRVRSC